MRVVPNCCISYSVQEWRTKKIRIFCPFCDDVREPEKFGIKSPVFRKRGIVDAGPRPLARCKRCKSMERERMLNWCISARIGIRHAKVLHFAPSYRLQSWLAEHGQLEVTCTDLMPRRYPRVGHVVKADITALPFPTDSFDFIVCSHVLEHIPDDLRALSELNRILKPGGLSFILVPLITDGLGPVEDLTVKTAAERLEFFGQADHVRIYDSKTLEHRMAKAGMEVQVFDPYKENAIKAIAYGIGQGNAILIGKKSS